MALADLLIAQLQSTYNLASLKEQKAARKAQEAYNQKLIELQQQGLALQADQLAKNYAMQQAQLEWDKESFREQFGADERQRGWENAFQEKQAALDEQWRTAEQTGFRDGVPTLANLQFQESQRQFNVGQQNWASEFAENNRRYEQDFGEDRRRYNQDFGEDQRRYDQDFGEDRRRYDQDFGENQRQFNVGQVMNAARGPADWAAYTSKLRMLQGSGALPGATGAMFDPNARVASYSSGGYDPGHVLTNSELAMGMTGLSNGQQLQGTPWQGMGTGQQVYAGGSPDFSEQPQQSTMHTDSSNPYSESGEPKGGSQKIASMLGYSQPQQQMAMPSMQKFRRFAPTEQAMGLGYLAENGGPTEDDAQYLMERQSPQFKRSQTARYAGI